MKRRLVIATLCMLFLVFAVGWSCNDALAAEKEYVRIGTGTTGATFYMIGSGLCKLINENANWLDATPQVGGSLINTRRVGTQQLAAALVTHDTAYHAIYGGPEFKNESYPDIRAVFSGHVSHWHVFTLEKSGIKTIQDLKGKKVSIGEPGGSIESVTREILKEANLIPDRDFKKYALTPAEAVEALKDGTIDVGCSLTGAPTGTIMDISTTHKIRLLPVSPDLQDKIIKKYPYYSKGVFQKGLYPGLEAPVPALTIGSYLIVNKNAKDEFAYLLAKVMAENSKALGEIHKAGLEWNLETVKKGFAIPVHPGALKYFKERGVAFSSPE